MPHPLAGCSIAPAKISRYLLDPTSIDGSAKAKFFMSFGFDPSNPTELETALKTHALANPVADSWTDAWGQHWNVVGPLRAPDGSRPIVLTAWIKDGDDPPRLVTAIPA